MLEVENDSFSKLFLKEYFSVFSCITIAVFYIYGGGLVAKSCPTLATAWTVASQTPQFMGFSRQEYWSGLPCPAPGDLPDSGIKPTSPVSPALAGRFF